MEKYYRVNPGRKSDDVIQPNEIRITTQGRMRKYISYGLNLFKVSWR